MKAIDNEKTACTILRMSSNAPCLLENRCLNASPATTACERCAQICPAKAISWQHHLPVIDPKRCTECQACAGICPTDAWQGKETPQQWLSLIEKAAGRTRLSVACHQASGQADAHIFCHGGWPLPVLVALAALGIRRIDCIGLTHCASCPHRHGSAIIERLQQALADWQRASGSSLSLTIGGQQGQAEEAPPRRRFFRMLSPAVAAGLREVALGMREAQQPQSAPRRTLSAPFWRLALLRRAIATSQLRFTPLPLSPMWPLGAISANEGCTGCDECVALCPTGALQMRPFGQQQALMFSPDACIGCRRCVQGCPEGVLEALPSVVLPNLASGEPRPLALAPYPAQGGTNG